LPDKNRGLFDRVTGTVMVNACPASMKSTHKIACTSFSCYVLIPVQDALTKSPLGNDPKSFFFCREFTHNKAEEEVSVMNCVN
jgi:hypothetical protein